VSSQLVDTETQRRRGDVPGPRWRSVSRRTSTSGKNSRHLIRLCTDVTPAITWSCSCQIIVKNAQRSYTKNCTTQKCYLLQLYVSCPYFYPIGWLRNCELGHDWAWTEFIKHTCGWI